jgi:hypothetical protein
MCVTREKEGGNKVYAEKSRRQKTTRQKPEGKRSGTERMAEPDMVGHLFLAGVQYRK